MSHAQVNPDLLAWSRLRAGLSEFEVAKSLPVKVDKIFEWETGESLPTFKQAQKWAPLAHVPFGFLFLSEPPEERLPLPDLRTVGGDAIEVPSLNLREVVKDVLRKQEWFLDYLKAQEADPLPFVGRYSLEASIGDVAMDMRRVLGVDLDGARPNYDEYLRLLIRGAEAAGVLVMRSGIVGSNTRRRLDVGEFRGFAISNRYAPVVFINSSDAPSARLFTLMHELAHIWIGSSGVSRVGVEEDRREEIYCNAVAGEFLAPESVFRNGWRERLSFEDNVSQLSSFFRVSALVVARRASDLGYISKAEYGEYYREQLRAFRDRDEGGGGSFYRNATAKNSARFSRAVVAEAMSGRMLLRDAAKLLAMQPSKLRTFASTFKE